MIPVWREAHHEVGGFIEGATKFGFDLVPLGMAWATPSGPVTDEFFEHFCDALVTGVRMANAGRRADRPARRDGHAEVPATPTPRCCAGCASALGPDVPLAVVARLPRQRLARRWPRHANILVGYQTYPHVDQRQRGLLAAELLTRAVKGEIRPVCHVAKPPMILNLLGQDTAREPMTVAHDEGPRGREAAGHALGQPDGRVPVRRRAGDGAERDRRGRRQQRVARRRSRTNSPRRCGTAREQLYVRCPDRARP